MSIKRHQCRSLCQLHLSLPQVELALFIKDVYCIFAHSLDWICSQKQRQQEESLQVSLSHICLKVPTIFQVLSVPSIFHQILGNNEGFQPSSFDWQQVPFPAPSLPISSLCWWVQQGEQSLRMLRYYYMDIMRKTCSPIASAMSLHQPFWGFSLHLHATLFSPIVFMKTSKENIPLLLFTVWKWQRVNISALLC